MDRPPTPPDPNALTQPIPVVPAAAPSPPIQSATFAQPPFTAPVYASPLPPAVAVEAPKRYVHRFGSIPFYLFGRFAAFAIDVFGVGFVLATFGFHATDVGYFVLAGHDASGYATLAGVSLGVALFFAFLCESLFGTTLGKAVFALHVRCGNGRHAGAGRVFVRYLLRPIDLLVIGPVLAAVTPRHQRIGDFVVNTVVARSRIGAFASVIGLALLVLVAYAQIAFGGGLTSAVGVAAETANYSPALVARAAAAFGAVPVLQPSATTNAAPQTQSTDAVPTPAPIASGEVQ